MRIVLTIVAVALVAILSIALIAPLFVDWSAHRAEIEGRLGAMAGARVSLSGPITLRLLPIPYLDLGAGSAVGPGQAAPRLSFEKARLELALVKLASGAVRFTEIRLEKPVLILARRADGSLNLPSAPSKEADAVGFDRLIARDGTIRIAVGAGGVLGQGATKGTQTQGDFLPIPYTDFIFAAFAEEHGFLGAVVVLLLYFFILMRLIQNAQTAADLPGTFLVMGVVAVLIFQIAVNIGMVVGLMPVTGIPLPLMSYGGSSVLFTFLALGMVMNVRMTRFVN